MTPYEELSAIHVGSSHVAKGLRCEDYAAAYSDPDMSMVMASDGHGDRNCFRSARGARFACEVAKGACKELCQQSAGPGSPGFEEAVLRMEARISAEWKRRVRQDVQEKPFSKEELADTSPEAADAYKAGRNVERAYGCTLVAAVCTSSWWLGLQIGDGALVAAYPDGAFVEPVPTDENCVGNVSTSLCNTNAEQSFRHFHSTTNPLAVYVCSDGVQESFDTADLYSWYASLAQLVQAKGKMEATAKLETYLEQITRDGSGDDVSVALMVARNSALAKPRQTLASVYEKVEAQNERLGRCTADLANARMDRDTAQRALDKAEKQIGEKGNEIDRQAAALSELRPALEKLEEDVSAARTRVQAEMDEYEREREELERRRQQIEGRRGDVARQEALLDEKRDQKEHILGELRRLHQEVAVHTEAVKETRALIDKRNSQVDKWKEREAHAREQVEKAAEFQKRAERFWFDALEKIGMHEELSALRRRRPSKVNGCAEQPAQNPEAGGSDMSDPGAAPVELAATPMQKAAGSKATAVPRGQLAPLEREAGHAVDTSLGAPDSADMRPYEWLRPQKPQPDEPTPQREIQPAAFAPPGRLDSCMPAERPADLSQMEEASSQPSSTPPLREPASTAGESEAEGAAAQKPPIVPPARHPGNAVADSPAESGSQDEPFSTVSHGGQCVFRLQEPPSAMPLAKTGEGGQRLEQEAGCAASTAEAHGQTGVCTDVPQPGTERRPPAEDVPNSEGTPASGAAAPKDAESARGTGSEGDQPETTTFL